jgi:hypothetical protein
MCPRTRRCSLLHVASRIGTRAAVYHTLPDRSDARCETPQDGGALAVAGAMGGGGKTVTDKREYGSRGNLVDKEHYEEPGMHRGR